MSRLPVLRYHEPPRAEWRGDSLRVSFSGEVAVRLRGPESLHITPLYISGGDTIRYPGLGCLTPSGARFGRRREALSGSKAAYRAHVLRRGGRGTADYSESMAVPSAMRGELRLLHVLTDCCSSRLLASERIAVPERAQAGADTVSRAAAGMLPLPVAAVSLPLFEANVTFIRPKAEAVKERTATATIRITYPADRWAVCPDFGDNGAELHRVDRLLSPMAADTATYSVSSVAITGYASPEGTWEHNMTLSVKRAVAMRDYLQARYHFPGCRLTAEGRGEDWDGLREAVRGSGMEARDKVLDIIGAYGIFDGRERELMQLEGGRPYRHMLQSLFPRLRRMEMRIDYRVRAFGADEAAALIGSRPQDLSLREMYEAARAVNSDRTIMRRRDGYGREYDIAARYFPDSDIASINASSAALVRGDLEQARQCLDRVRDNPRAYNNLGVYHWICGRTDEARAYFEKAMERDPGRAAYNLEQLRKWEDLRKGKEDGR